MRSFIPRIYNRPGLTCKGKCRTQTKYAISKINKPVDENSKRCPNVCEVTFYGCEDTTCMCCGAKLRYSTRTKIALRKEKLNQKKDKKKQEYIKKNNGVEEKKKPKIKTTYKESPGFRAGALKSNEKPKTKPLVIWFTDSDIRLRKISPKELLSKRDTRIKKIQYNIQVWQEYIKCYRIKKDTITQQYSETKRTYPCLHDVLTGIDYRIEKLKEKIEKLKELRIETYIKTCLHQYEEWHQIYSFEQMTTDIKDPKFNKFDFNALEKCPDCNQFLLPIGHKIDKQ